MTNISQKKMEPSDFYGFALIIGLSSSMQMIWSVSDLWVVGQVSVKYIAALGLVDAVFSIISALAYGVIDIHATQIANAEGRRRFTQDYPSLFFSATCVFLLSWLPVMVGSLVFVPALTAFGQPDDVITIGASNLEARAYLYLFSVFYIIIPLALRIHGYRKFSLGLLIFSFIIKILLNLNIHTLLPVVSNLNLEKAVVYTTSIAQIFTIAVGGAFLFFLSTRDSFKLNFETFRESIRDLIAHTPRIAAWNVNDFVSSSLVVMVLGGFGVNYLAAANIASKITSLFYRLPQALSESALVYYGYVAEEVVQRRRQRATAVLRYSCIPVFFVSVIIFFSAEWLIKTVSPAFSGRALEIAAFMIKIHMIVALFYVAQHACSQFLVVERRTKFLLFSSLISTWILVVPGVLIVRYYGLSGEAVVLFERFSIVVIGLVNLVYFYRGLGTFSNVKISSAAVTGRS
ncbi:MATE family efflux transporter [Pseudomonas syringae]|uniref:MATE family efflux transporter n=1 Tax=Pseudomonas syringae TaxID=317 RepID=UPI00164C8AE4|nr:MATE family efflux transporter [Pseudomonas syringae]